MRGPSCVRDRWLSTGRALYRHWGSLLGVRELREGDQAHPTPNDHPDVTELVISDLRGRRELGIGRYGTTLQPWNGRNALLDLYQELLDGAQYARQRMEEDAHAVDAMFTPQAELTFRGDMTVHLVDSMADDRNVVAAARVSTLGDAAREGAETIDADSPEDKLIRFLLKNRHGSPFEHSVLTFFVEAPIFVFRELMRHRIASYNEESGRYRQLRPVFYVPTPQRKLVQVGKAGRYSFEDGSDEQRELVRLSLQRAAKVAYATYEDMLASGVAREVARMVLPVSTYSSAYVTMNARALMNFLSLRVNAEGSLFPSFPQREIEMVAELMEQQWQRLMPLTHKAFIANGRVGP